MPDTVITRTLTTLDQTVTVGCEDNPLVGIEVSGTWAGTLTIETNLDPDNPLWRAGKVFTEAGVAAPAAITANGRWVVQAAIVGQVRARLNPATSGAVVVTLRAGDSETFGLGGGGGGGGGAVSIADGADFAQGTTTDNAIQTSTTGTTPGTGISFWRGIVNLLVALVAKFPAALVGGKLDVNLGTSSITLPVSNASLPLPSGASTETTLALIKAKTDNLDALLSSRTKPADAQHAIIDSGTVTANATLQAGAATAGNVGGIEALPQATFTRPVDTIAYAANDALCNSTTAPAALTFAAAALTSGRGGFVIGATVIDEANQTTKLNCTLHLFSAVPATLTNDNAALALAVADLANYLGNIKFTTATVLNTAAGASGSVALTGALQNPLPYKCAATSLFGVLQADNAYTPVSAEVFIVILNLSLDA